MRLLDMVAHSCAPSPGLPLEWGLPSPCHFAVEVLACPLRLVLSDELTRCATLLAYAEGRRLSGCFDLVRVPTEHLWVEWLEAPHVEALNEVKDLTERPHKPSCSRAGVLINASRSGRSGELRKFWCMRDESSYSGAVVTEFDLDSSIRPILDVPAFFQGASVGVGIPDEPAIDAILQHVSYRLDPAWVAYYRAAALSSLEQEHILRCALGTTAFDLPMLLALFLLYGARQGVSLHRPDLSRLNARRQKRGKTPLLEHVEVTTPLTTPFAAQGQHAHPGRFRQRPRLHHVRGHIARRGSTVFWRSPHLRGNERQGVIKSRTVRLTMQ